MIKKQFENFKEFLDWKESDEFKKYMADETDVFATFTMMDVNPHNNTLEQFIINDVSAEVSDVNGDGYVDHILFVIGRWESSNDIRRYSKTCLAPENSDLDWDKVSCSYTW